MKTISLNQISQVIGLYIHCSLGQCSNQLLAWRQKG